MADTSNDQQDQFPLAAQIPLSSFTLPTFPDAASRLRALTLTCDIGLNEYQSKHLQLGTFEPSTTLPASITHLTLELFSLGFPAPFLSGLIKSLPNLQSLTLFSCLIDGIDDNSRQDATSFFQAASKTLRELHIVDTFSRTGFWKDISGQLNPVQGSGSSLRILEVSYTYRGHYESDFLNRTGGEEWANLIAPSLVGLSLNFQSPPKDLEDVGMKAEKAEDQDELAAQDGILPYASDGRASQAIRDSFEKLGKGSNELKVLNLTMYAMKAGYIGQIVKASAGKSKETGLVGLSASVLLEDGWMNSLVEGLKQDDAGSTIESIELVGVPLTAEDEMTSAPAAVEGLLVANEEQVKELELACPKLDRFETALLKSKRLGSIVWERVDGNWKMTREAPEA